MTKSTDIVQTSITHVQNCSQPRTHLTNFSMLKAARQKEIVALLQGGGVVEVAALAERFQTSPITVRRDLIELQEGVSSFSVQ